MGGVHQNFPYGLCDAVWTGGDARGIGGLAHWEGLSGGDKLPSRGEDGSDGIQPAGGLADRPAESPDGGAVDPRIQNDGLADGGSRGGGVGRRSVAIKSALSDLESVGTWDRLFLFANEEVYLGFSWVFGSGLGDGSGRGVAGGEGGV